MTTNSPVTGMKPHVEETLATYSPARGLQDLPLECLLHILRRAPSGADQEALEQTCKALRRALHSPVHWKQRLAEDFGVSLSEVPPGDGLPFAGSSRDNYSPTLKEIKGLYKQLTSPSSEQSIRFRGCYTDGGCDGGQLRYWMDNMFVPNHWESYCTDNGSNVNCVGVLIDPDSYEVDLEAATHRNYLMKRLKYASQQVFQGPTDLDAWTTAELEHFFQQLYTELQQRAGIGYLLVDGFPGYPTMEELRQLDVAMERLQQRQAAYAHILPRREGEEMEAEEGSCESRATDIDRLQLYDNRVGELMDRDRGTRVVGSVDCCSVSRIGHFSCPVSCGAIFMGSLPAQRESLASDFLRHTAQSAVRDKCSLALNSAMTRADVEAAVAVGHLPPIVSTGGYAGAEWVEFSRDWGNFERGYVVRPVIWFKFFTSSETKERQHLGFPSRQMPDEQDPMEGIEGTQAAEAPPGSPDSAAPDYAMMDFEDDGMSEDDEDSAWNALCKTTDGRNYLKAPLVQRRGGNLVMVKLISHEDLRTEWEDDHAQPNIDVNYVKFHGNVGVQTVPLR